MPESQPIKFAQPEWVTPSFSPEYFAIELFPVGLACAIVTATLLAGAPGTLHPHELVHAVQTITAVSLTLWCAGVVILSLALRPISRALFLFVSAGPGSWFPPKWKRLNGAGPWFKLAELEDEHQVGPLKDAHVHTGLDVVHMTALLSDQAQAQLRSDRYAWEGSTRTSIYLTVAAAVAFALTWGAWVSTAAVVLPIAVYARSAYCAAVTGQRRAAANTLLAYESLQIADSPPRS